MSDDVSDIQYTGVSKIFVQHGRIKLIKSAQFGFKINAVKNK